MSRPLITAERSAHVIKREEGKILSDIIRDFKRHTSKNIVKQIQHEPESRREWMLHCFRAAALNHPKAGEFKFWQYGYHPVELYSAKLTQQKLNYIHQNPVAEMLVISHGVYV